jgi:ATP-dependent Clp protease protease subunit
MSYSKYQLKPTYMDDEPDEKEPKEEKGPELGMLAKKMEKYFFESRVVELWGPVDDRSAKEVVTKLRLLDADKPGEEIKFFINSPGGVVSSGFVIYDTMRMMKSPVSTICMGLAASMGSILLSGGTKGRRFVYPLSEIMIHQPSLGGYMHRPGNYRQANTPGKRHQRPDPRGKLREKSRPGNEGFRPGLLDGRQRSYRVRHCGRRF